MHEKRKSLPASFFKQFNDIISINSNNNKDIKDKDKDKEGDIDNITSMFKKLSKSSSSSENNNSSNNNVTILSTQQQQQQQSSQPQPPPIQQQRLTQLPNLANNEPLERLRELNRNNLGDVLSLVKASPFALVIDSKTTSLLNLIADVTFLRSQGSEKIYKLNKGRLDTECRSIVYLLRPTFHNINMVIDHIRQHRLDGLKKDYTIIYIPKINLKCERLLEEEGCAITSLEYPLDLVALDHDLLSLELPTLYADIHLDHDKSPLALVTRSIQRLQTLYDGVIPHFKGKGHYSKMVFDSLKAKYNGHQMLVSREVDAIMLIDREVDYITPLCTPLTYEGLIDDFFSINNNIVQIDEHIMEHNNNNGNNNGNGNGNNSKFKKNKQQQQQQQGKQSNISGSGQKISYPLHSGDRIYNQLRDMNFSKLVGTNGILNMITKNLDDPRLDGSESLATIKNVIRKLNASRIEENSLSIHISLSIQIQTITSDKYFSNILENEQRLLNNQDIHLVEEYIEDCIIRKELLWRVLKLMSLYSMIEGGFNSRLYNRLKMRIIQIYGCQHLNTLNNLEKVGLLKEIPEINGGGGIQSLSSLSGIDNGGGHSKRDTQSTFNWLCEELQLVKEDVDELEPNDIGFVHSGYAPLSCRLIQHAFSKKLDGWKGIDQIMKILPGPTFEESYPFSSSSSSSNPIQQQSNHNNINHNSNGNISNGRLKTILYFIGGITRSEISAIRYLGNHMNRDFIIVTTKVISNGSSSSSIFSNLIENFE